MTTSRHMTTSPRLDTAAVLGVWLIVQGGMQIVLAFHALSVRRRARPGRTVPVM
jgi:hypothetical protein